MANISKFRRGAALSGKRAACARIEEEVRRRIRLDPRHFASLIMPSKTRYEIDFLNSAGVPLGNSQIVERDRESFEEIYEAVGRDTRPEDVMTSRAMGLGKRIATLRRPFDWMNLDLCGPIQRELISSVSHLAKWCFREGSCLEITVKCARENKGDNRRIYMLAEACTKLGGPAGTLMERRFRAMFTLLVMVPAEHGWIPDGYMPTMYREDRANGRTGIPMMCHMATGYRHDVRDSGKKIRELWRDACG